MIRHLFKLAWNRKRANLLLMLEYFVSFLVLFAVTTMAVYYADNYRQPLGFDFENVWNVDIDMKQTTDDVFSAEQKVGFEQALRAVRAFEEVEAAAGALSAPYGWATSITGIDHRGQSFEVMRNEVTDDFARVMGLELVRGRWFEDADEASRFEGVVINERLAEDFFSGEDPIGQTLGEDERAPRVIGVVTDFRQHGEYADPGYYSFTRASLVNPEHRPVRNILLKVRPGTTAAFEQQLIERLSQTVRGWSFDVKPLERMRASYLRLRLTPLVILAVVAGFLMVMVGLGMTGVLWQSVTRRTGEIGLRRALGGTVRDIRVQVVGELLVVATLGAALGALLVLQLPLLEMASFLNARVFTAGLLVAFMLIYLLTVLCGLYPSRLATRVHPAEALHYE